MITVNLKFSHDTKGTYVFKQVDKNGHFLEDFRDGTIPQVYIRKAAFNGGPVPLEVELTVKDNSPGTAVGV